jgi:protein-tyrosine sulfotransferase
MMFGHSTRQDISHWIRSALAPLAGAFPLNDAASRSISPVMIVGCGRSGNTLLRSMLVHGGEIAIPPESYVWPAIARGYAHWRYSSWRTVTDQVVDAFTRSEFALSSLDRSLMKARAQELPGLQRSLASILNIIYESHCRLSGFAGRRWGDKTPFNILDIGVIQPIFPAAQYIHIVRDPRAVALSYVKAARTSSGIRETTFADSARRWRVSVRNARALRTRVGSRRYCELRYEDLVRAPEEELRRICQFLGEAYTPAMLSFDEGANKLGDVPSQAHHAKVRTPLDPSRCNGWASEISRPDRETVDEITSGYRQLFGYR